MSEAAPISISTKSLSPPGPSPNEPASGRSPSPNENENLNNEEPSSPMPTELKANEITLNDLTENERASITKLRNMLKEGSVSSNTLARDQLHVSIESDPVLLRFLIARKFDVDKAKEMLLACIDWRKTFFPIPYDSIHDEFIKGKYFSRGVDKQGRPLIIVRAKFMDPAVRDLNQAVKCIIAIIEDSIYRMGPGVSQYTVFYDREGMSMSKNRDLDLIKACAKIFSDNYPERLHCAMIYPTGMIFRTFWATIKYLFDQRTRDKVVMLKSKEHILDFVDVNQLHKDYGGTDNWDFDNQGKVTATTFRSVNTYATGSSGSGGRISVGSGASLFVELTPKS